MWLHVKPNNRKDESKKHEKYIYTKQTTMKIKLVLQYKINLKEKSNIKYKDDHRSMMKGKVH